MDLARKMLVKQIKRGIACGLAFDVLSTWIQVFSRSLAIFNHVEKKPFK